MQPIPLATAVALEEPDASGDTPIPPLFVIGFGLLVGGVVGLKQRAGAFDVLADVGRESSAPVVCQDAAGCTWW